MRIKSPQVRVISPEGRQLGIMDTPKAIALALQFNLDLVEVAAAATPPVCRIMDFGKYVYEEQKKHAHSKPAGTKLKEIEFTVRIEAHDFETKLRHAEEFLDHGNKVKLRLKFRGREMAHTEIGFGVMKKALDELASMGHPRFRAEADRQADQRHAFPAAGQQAQAQVPRPRQRGAAPTRIRPPRSETVD
ncbi:MAG: translation initiation factor IF-3 [Lacunisphaera sp.]